MSCVATLAYRKLKILVGRQEVMQNNLGVLRQSNIWTECALSWVTYQTTLHQVFFCFFLFFCFFVFLEQMRLRLNAALKVNKSYKYNHKCGETRGQRPHHGSFFWLQSEGRINCDWCIFGGNHSYLLRKELWCHAKKKKKKKKKNKICIIYFLNTFKWKNFGGN
jgi:hypothetical protein